MHPCPACLHVAPTTFYEALRVPTTSNLLMKTLEASINWPRGDVRLAFCHRCGFIWNVSFDPATQKLSAEYEATQACSPTFGQFARELAQAWIGRYDLRGKRIVEIGSGRRGEFLRLICDMAGATGVGIDPIADANESTDRVRFIAAEMSPALLSAADFVICRHTLEHIADVRGFLGAMVAGVSNHPAVLAIEVPDTLRVLREAAFWDIYYEHCSYFTAGSLSRALQSFGLSVLRHDLLYSGQYLVMEARSGVDHGGIGESADTLAHEQNAFVARVAESRRRWRTILDDGRSTVLWGAGSKAVGFLSTLGITNEIAAVVDINPGKQNSFLPGTGHEIIAPDRLGDLRPERVIVMNPVYMTEITRQLAEMGLRPEVQGL